jgi:hypothetical protein
MTLMRLGVQGLAPPEAGLVRALMVLLARNTEGFRWVLVQHPPFEALIVGEDLAGRSRFAPEDHATAVVAGLDEPPPGMPAARVLARPLRQEQLAAWLAEVQHRPALQPGTGSPGQSAPREPQRVRLRRWPPRSLVHDDPKRIRLAAMLTRRHLSLPELVTLSGVPEAQCTVFLHVLQGIGVLETLRTAQPAAGSAPAAPGGRVASTPVRTLIRRLRLHLGMEG